MSIKIPNSSEIIAGLLSQDNYLKLQGLSSSFGYISGSSLTYQSGNFTDLVSTKITGTYATIDTGTFNILTATYLNLNGVSDVSPMVVKVLGTNFSCSASTIEYLPFSQSIVANENWLVEGMLDTVLTGTGGIYLSIFSPTGSLVGGCISGREQQGLTRLVEARAQIPNSEINLAVSTSNLVELPVNTRFSIRNGGNAGMIRIGIRRGIATDFCHIITGSYMKFIKDDLVY